MSKIPTLTFVADVTSAQIKAAEGDGPAKMILNGYNGGLLRLNGFDTPLVVDLSTVVDSPGGAPRMLMEHDYDKPLGHLEDIENTGTSLNATGVLSFPGENRDKVIASSKDNFLWKVSVGMEPSSAGEIVRLKKGATATINDRTINGPALIAKSFSLEEMSLVMRAADASTSGRLAASYFNESEPNLKDNKMSDITKEEIAPVIATATETNLEDEVKALRAEHSRIAEIDAKTDGHPSIRAKAVSEGWSPLQAELEVLKASRPNIQASKSSDMVDADALRASLHLALGRDENKVYKEFGDKTIEAARKNYSGMSLNKLVQAINISAGNGYNSSDTAAFGLAVKASGFSTLSLPELLGDAANKLLLDGFGSVEVESQRIARTVDVSNLQSTKLIRVNIQDGLKPVGNTGMIEHVGLTEESYAVQAKTLAGMLQVSRQDIINDSLAGISDASRMMGVAAANGLSQSIFEALKLSAGSATSSKPLNATNLGGAMASLRGQKVNGKPVGARGRFLVVGPDLEFTALQLIQSSTVDSTNGNSNPFAGRLEVIVDDFATVTGQWTLVSDPNFAPAVGVAFLRGQRTPTIEQGDVPFNQLGVAFRVIFDAAASPLDSRGAKSFAA